MKPFRSGVSFETDVSSDRKLGQNSTTYDCIVVDIVRQPSDVGNLSKALIVVTDRSCLHFGKILEKPLTSLRLDSNQVGRLEMSL